MSRNVVLYIAMSLDGYIARKNEDVSWLEGDGSEVNADFGYEAFYSTIDTVIMGRKTYDQILTFGDYPYKGTRGYVYTSKEEKSTENVTFTSEDPQSLISRLKEEEGKDIWLIGGAQLIDDFIKKGLIDAYVITIIPTILGSGISLFRDKNPETSLKLLKCQSVNGMAMLTYEKR